MSTMRSDETSSAAVAPQKHDSLSPFTLTLVSQMNELMQSNLRLLERLDLSAARAESAQADHAAVGLELARVRQELTEVQQKQAANSNELAATQADLTDAKSKLSDALSRLDDRTAAYDALMARSSETESLLHSLQRSHKQLLEEHSALQSHHPEAESSLSSLQVDHEGGLESAADLRGQLQSLEAKQAADSATSKQETAELRQKYTNMQVELHAVIHDLQANQTQVDDLHRRLAKSESELARATEAAADSKREVDATTKNAANRGQPTRCAEERLVIVRSELQLIRQLRGEIEQTMATRAASVSPQRPGMFGPSFQWDSVAEGRQDVANLTRTKQSEAYWTEQIAYLQGRSDSRATSSRTSDSESAHDSFYIAQRQRIELRQTISMTQVNEESHWRRRFESRFDVRLTESPADRLAREHHHIQFLKQWPVEEQRSMSTVQAAIDQLQLRVSQSTDASALVPAPGRFGSESDVERLALLKEERTVGFKRLAWIKQLARDFQPRR